MSWLKDYLYLGLIGVLLLPTNGDNSVHIMSKYGQLITSSTLNWLPRSHYDSSHQIVVGGFQIPRETEEDLMASNNAPLNRPNPFKRPLHVCRALHNGVMWVSGTQLGDDKRCTVSIHGNVRSYEKYDLLENVDNAARISWRHWNTYTQLPVGTVATDKMYVARHEVSPDETDPNLPFTYTHYIGTMNMIDNFGTIFYVKHDGIEKTSKSGEILVETEPIYYELSGVKLNWPKKRVIKSPIPNLIWNGTLKNEGEKGAKLAEAVAYSYYYSMYWGQGHAILKGLNTSISLYNGTKLPTIIWGTQERENLTEVRKIEIYLEPGTGVNVTLTGNYTDMEIPYTGELVSHYEDKVTTSRLINGICRQETLLDVKPTFGPIYYLKDYSLVPTTTPPPVVTEPTTTVKFAYDEAKGTRQPNMDDPGLDENMIVIPKTSDTSNMQGDDGGPLSLKNKIETANSGVSSLEISLLIVSITTVVISRIA